MIPQKREPPQQDELDAVERIVSAFKAERLYALPVKRPTEDEPEPKPVAKPLYIDDRLLLREYEKLAANGDTCAGTRAALLRCKIGEEESGERA